MNEESEVGRASEVNRSMESLQTAIQDLTSTNDRLEGIFNNILRQSEPSPDTEKQDEKCLVPLAHAIRECTRNVRNETSRVMELLERVEL